MTLAGLLDVVRRYLQDSAWGNVARGAWCREQRLHLSVPGHSVVWVRGDVVPWAAWGERRGYFKVKRMDGLAYLCALGTPGA